MGIEPTQIVHKTIFLPQESGACPLFILGMGVHQSKVVLY